MAMEDIVDGDDGTFRADVAVDFCCDLGMRGDGDCPLVFCGTLIVNFVAGSAVSVGGF